MRIIAFLIALLLALLTCGRSAEAFHEIESFARSEKGGGNGVYFTGSPRFKSYDCRICHTQSENKISIALEVNRPELLQGAYERNTGYALTIKLIGEHKGLASAFNPNTFMLEIVDAKGNAVGDFLTGPAPTTLADERRVVAGEGFGEGETEWSLTWFSPQDDAGPLQLYIAMVDGDGAGEADIRFIDPLNDDVAIMVLRLCPTGEVCPAEPGDPQIDSPVHCGVAASTSLPAAAIVWMAIFLVLMLSRRQRHLLSRIAQCLGILALSSGLPGCSASSQTSTSAVAQPADKGGFQLRYRLASQSALSGPEALAALDQSLSALRKRASTFKFSHAIITRVASEVVVDLPGENELSIADLRELLPVQGRLELRLVRHEGDFMPQLCDSLSSDSRAGVMRIETGMDAWQDAGGAHITQCYLAASDRVAMLNAEEAEVEGCPWRGDSERTRCVVSGRRILQRYLAQRGDIQVEPGYELAFEGSESFALEGESGERYWRSYYLQTEASMDGNAIASAYAKKSPDVAEDELRITFNDQDKRQLAALSANNIGRKLAILIDGDVQSAPVIRSAIQGGVLTLTLGPASRPAAILAAALRSGGLPARLVEVSATAY